MHQSVFFMGIDMICPKLDFWLWHRYPQKFVVQLEDNISWHANIV